MTRLRPCSPFACGAFFFGTLLWAASAQAALGLPWTLTQLVQKSDVTVLGHPLRRAASWQGGRIVTRIEVAVDEVWQGSVAAGETLDVLVLGGEVGELAQKVEGAAQLPTYGRVVLHLRRSEAGFLPTGMAQGVWRVDGLWGEQAAVRPQIPALWRHAAALRQNDGAPLPDRLLALKKAVQEAARAKP